MWGEINNINCVIIVVTCHCVTLLTDTWSANQRPQLVPCDQWEAGITWHINYDDCDQTEHTSIIITRSESFKLSAVCHAIWCLNYTFFLNKPIQVWLNKEIHISVFSIFSLSGVSGSIEIMMSGQLTWKSGSDCIQPVKRQGAVLSLVTWLWSWPLIGWCWWHASGRCLVAVH